MKAFKILGFSDENTTCDRCGRAELKGTYTIQTKDGDLFRLGSSCINKAFQMTTKGFKSQLKAETKEANNAFNIEYNKLKEPFEVQLKSFNTWSDETIAIHDKIEDIAKELHAKYPLAPYSARFNFYY